MWEPGSKSDRLGSKALPILLDQAHLLTNLLGQHSPKPRSDWQIPRPYCCLCNSTILLFLPELCFTGWEAPFSMSAAQRAFLVGTVVPSTKTSVPSDPVLVPQRRPPKIKWSQLPGSSGCLGTCGPWWSFPPCPGERGASWSSLLPGALRPCPGG